MLVNGALDQSTVSNIRFIVVGRELGLEGL